MCSSRVGFYDDVSVRGSLLVPSQFNPFTFKSSSQNNVCYFHTFENDLGMKRNFTKYLKEICCLSSDQHFSLKCFQKNCFCKGNISKIVRPLLAALSVNGLKTKNQAIPFMPGDLLDEYRLDLSYF